MQLCTLAAWKIDSLMDLIGPAFVALFFFILPILRAIKEAKEKQREAEARRTQAPSEEKSEEEKAQEMWADLLRGEAPAPPPPPPPPPPPRAVPQTLPTPEAPAPLAPSIEVFSGSPTEAEMESTFDEARAAQDQNDAALRDERARREGFLRREREGAETPRASVEPSDMTSFDVSVSQTADGRAQEKRRRDLLGLATNRRAALQRALVGAEVLGRPVALRTGSEEIGPLALRR
jgi:hypothetical protein